MNYIIAKEVETGVERIYQTELPVEKKAYVIVENYDGDPVTAEIVKVLKRYDALTAQSEIHAVIAHIDVKAWIAKRNKEMDNQILFGKMQSKIENIKLRKQLEKFAGEDSEMRELLEEYDKEFGKPNATPSTSLDEDMEY